MKLGSTCWRTLVLAILTSLVTGCVVGPDFKPPSAPKVDTYVQPVADASEAPSLVYGARIADDWYTLFRSELPASTKDF